MTDLTMAELAGRQVAKLQAAKAQNRIAYPETARVVDALESVFGKVKVIWAEENGKTIGRKAA